MKTSKIVLRGVLPAMLGLVSLSTDVDAIAGGRKVFNYLEVTTDFATGYSRDTIRVDSIENRLWRQTDGTNISNFFPLTEHVCTRRNNSHIRSTTTFNAYEGEFTNSFMELMAGLGTSTTEHTDYEVRLDERRFETLNGFAPGAKHFFNARNARNSHGKARNNWDLHLIVGYDLSKTRDGNKAATFKPFFGYFFTHAQSSVQKLNGDLLGAENGTGKRLAGQALVETRPFWHGYMIGLMSDVRWGNRSVFLRGDARISRTRSHKTTTEILKTASESMLKFGPDKKIPTWRYLGYTISMGYRYHLGPDWTFFTDTWYMNMADKRYSHRPTESDPTKATDKVRLPNRIEKLVHRRVDVHAGFAFHY